VRRFRFASSRLADESNSRKSTVPEAADAR
jgi:hypothetical protein